MIKEVRDGFGRFLHQEFSGEDGQSFTQQSHYDDPVKGPMRWRSVTKIVDKNTHVFDRINAY
jgi:hypothetical protein